jgi:hypothetical protein
LGTAKEALWNIQDPLSDIQDKSSISCNTSENKLLQVFIVNIKKIYEMSVARRAIIQAGSLRNLLKERRLQNVWIILMGA